MLRTPLSIPLAANSPITGIMDPVIVPINAWVQRLIVPQKLVSLASAWVSLMASAVPSALE